MSTLAKIFVVFVFVLTVALFGSSATLYLNRENWRVAYMDMKRAHETTLDDFDSSSSQLRSRIEALRTENASLGTEVANITTKNKQQETKIQQLDTNMKDMELTVQKTADALKKSQETVDSLDDTLQAKDQLINQLREAEQTARGAQEKAVADVTRLMLDYSKLNDEHAQLQVVSASQRDNLEKYQIILSNMAEVGIKWEDFEVPYIDGIVEAVNASDQLVVLSVGKDQKAREGYEFLVHRGPEYIGKLRVIRVYDDLSGARVVYTAPGKMVQVGDRVRTTLSAQ